MQAEQSGKKTFVGGALLLVAAAFFTKLIGLFYKIPLLAVVGVEGMAYFLAAYHVYSLLFVLAATGLPAALSLLVARALAAGRPRAARRTLGVSLAVFLALGAAGTAALALFAAPLAARLSMPSAASSLVSIAPALLLGVLMGAARGFFQGHGKMGPTALSEVLEAVGKLGFGVAFALAARRAGADTAGLAAAAIFGITAGMVPAALYLFGALALFLRRRPPQDSYPLPPRRTVLARLLRVAFPITVSASVMSVVALVDTALISGRLQSLGYAANVANAMYSSYGNLAVPLYNLVPSLLSPLALALAPALAAAHTRGDARDAEAAVRTALRLTALAAIPAALGLGVFAHPILSLIYHGRGEAVAVAAPLLSLLALSVFPAALVTLTGACLQAVGRVRVPVVSMLAGAAVKLLVEWALFAFPAIHINAAPWSTLACHLTVLLINAAVLSRVLPFRLPVGRDLFRPLAAAALSVAAGVGVYRLLARTGLPALSVTPAALLAVVLLFAALALRLRAVTAPDLLTLPGGEGLCRMLQKCKLLERSNGTN